MEAEQSAGPLDSIFYQPADIFFPAQARVALTYDDLTLSTLYSEILPKNASLDTELAGGLCLHLPIISADMDTVTESRMATGMALNGGLGLIHYNMTEKQQLKEVSRVKNHVHGLIQEPITVQPDKTVGDVIELIESKRYSFSTFPVVGADRKLAGLLSGNVLKSRYASKPVTGALVPREQVQTLRESQLGADPIAIADRFFTDNPGINKLLVVDDNDELRGLFTLSDIERITSEKQAQFKPTRDDQFRLLCGAAVSTPRNADGKLDRERIETHVGALIERGVDVVAVSTAHGHSKGVGDAVRLIRTAYPELPIIAGNVTTAAGVEYLADCGANIIKIGQGPGSICTTRLVAGVGIPQMTALYVASQAAKTKGVSLLADGGITKSGDIVKALTLADGVICGGLLAGCPETPGQVMEISGKLYKQYRGMGSLAAMKSGSAARYGHTPKDANRKIAAEGIEALKEVSEDLDQLLGQLIGGVQAGMGYLGAATLPDLRARACYTRISPAGQKEAAPHDVVEMKASS
ncbi:MAG TPA: IMP dehydrogenase [Verrucomicrobiota bacterium]|jgi:IMP dehydrogenase|nr:IMP dehydrogenase [Verrucomicrobiota bacterium]